MVRLIILHCLGIEFKYNFKYNLSFNLLRHFTKTKQSRRYEFQNEQYFK